MTPEEARPIVKAHRQRFKNYDGGRVVFSPTLEEQEAALTLAGPDAHVAP